MTSLSLSRQRSLQVLLALFLLYLSLLFCFEFPFMSQHGPTAAGGGAALTRVLPLHSSEDPIQNSAPIRPSKPAHRLLANSDPPLPSGRSSIVSTLTFEEFNTTLNPTDLHSSAGHAWELGRKLFDELQSAPSPTSTTLLMKNTEQTCPGSVMLTGAELTEQGGLMAIPCGLTLGSHITLVGRPRSAHPDYSPKITELKKGNSLVMVSQFMMELQGIDAVDGEAPPKILHFNPRLKGDWSGHPVIEQNTCYRMQWGKSLRCDGRRSKTDEEAVDGLVKCEEWIRHDDSQSEDSNTKAWLKQLMGKQASVDFQFPFIENRLFVLTLSTGLEGYHVTVDGRHVTSFPYHPGFALEDATGLVLNGDIEVQSIFAAALPASHPSVTPQRSLQLVPQLKAPSLPDGPVELFVGILSAANHFAERMAVRRSWMSLVRKSSNAVVARFFVALHRRKEVNEELKREAEFFGDIVIVPYMDSYDLVVLKTVAIAEFGVHTISAKYVMKCDDDTFVRVDSVLKELRKIPINLSFYVGNINFYHKPLRTGKWAVTFEEWPEEDYPPYANGPGYIISSDIAHFVVSEFEKRTIRLSLSKDEHPSLYKCGPASDPPDIVTNKSEPMMQLFKMEDVSMGMWVEQFNDTTPVEYLHSLKFCQFGCIDGYFTAHYQSPRQMMCLWEKLRAGKPQCCNMR